MTIVFRGGLGVPRDEGRISEARYNGVPYISKPTFQLHAWTTPTERGKWRCFSLARLASPQMGEQTGTWRIYSRETTHVEGEVIAERKRLNGRRPDPKLPFVSCTRQIFLARVMLQGHSISTAYFESLAIPRCLLCIWVVGDGCGIPQATRFVMVCSVAVCS